MWYKDFNIFKLNVKILCFFHKLFLKLEEDAVILINSLFKYQFCLNEYSYRQNSVRLKIILTRIIILYFYLANSQVLFAYLKHSSTKKNKRLP